MIKVTVNPWFDRFILLVIIVNSACLALDDPKALVRPEWLGAMDIFFIVVFTGELVIKIIAMGLVM